MAKRLLYICLIWFISVTSVYAEVVVLRSGQQVRGEVLLSNDDVVIVRKKDGTRYQYPRAEVLSIQSEDAPTPTLVPVPEGQPKRVAIRLVAAGGAAYVPYAGWGGAADMHLMVGSHNLLDRQIFLGGSFGYRGVFQGNKDYSWLPLQLVLHHPIALDSSLRSCPLLGASFGYAFATKKQWGGGLCAGLDLGWLYQINASSSFSMSLTAQWQQTHIDVVETIASTDYTNHVGCSIVCVGLKLGVQF